MPVEFRTIEAPSTWKMFPRHQAGEDYADMAAPLAKRMRDGIEKYGVMLRAVVLKRESGGLCVLDGWQMYQGCIAADVKPEFVELVSGIEPQEFVEIKNDVRRHENNDARKKRLKDRKGKLKEMVANGTPVNEAAETLGIGRTTAFRDLKVERVPIVRCERCERINATGNDCPHCQLLRIDAVREPDEPVSMNEQVAEPSKEKTKAPPECISNAVPLPSLLDANFVIVPAEALEAFEVASELAHLCHDVDQIAKSLAKILAHKVGARAISPTAAQRFADLRQHIWQARATHVCAYCQGKGGECAACRGQGWQPGAAFSQAPPEMQDAMRKLGARNVPI